jgi:hypothetical protein
MAKKNKKAAKLSSRMTDLAEDLGTFLGTSERKATEWLSRQQQLRKQLSAIRDRATALLSQLGPSTDKGKKSKGADENKKATKGKGAEQRKKSKGAEPANAAANAKARKTVKRAAKPAPRRATKAPKAAPKPAAPMLEPDMDDLDVATDE